MKFKVEITLDTQSRNVSIGASDPELFGPKRDILYAMLERCREELMLQLTNTKPSAKQQSGIIIPKLKLPPQ